MKTVVDENIIFAREAFEEFGTVNLVNGREIKKEMLTDTDALIVRSITNVNEELLKGSRVKFVGTATIGDDHIDKEYLQRENIIFTNAAGCNANSVVEYVFCGLIYLLKKYKLDPKHLSIGIAGAGRIGGRVAKVCETLGMKVLLNDPPLKRKTGDEKYLPLEEVLQCDVVTFHTPLNRGGIDNTVHLLNGGNLEMIKAGAIIINTSRGEVIDNKALWETGKEKKLKMIIDVWENEPDISSDLLDLCEIGTPHIAGYSTEGKANGTKMVYDKLCEFLGREKKWKPMLDVEREKIKVAEMKRYSIEELFELTSGFYEIMRDDKMLREAGGKNFDELRRKYPFRREFLSQ
ncbi:MAG: 4-phosphoerythronate dehydrogenase [Ignavibacteriaceae bacterium]